MPNVAISNTPVRSVVVSTGKVDVTLSEYTITDDVWTEVWASVISSVRDQTIDVTRFNIEDYISTICLALHYLGFESYYMLDLDTIRWGL